MARIVTNSNANTVFKSYNRNLEGMSRSAERLASGLRINRAADDAAGLAISETMRAQVKGADMATENIGNAINFINTAEGYLQNISDILGRMEELAVEYTDDTKSSDDKSNINVEFQKLSTELNEIVTSRAKFNSKNIFTTADAMTIQVGADAGQLFNIGTDARNLNTGAFTAVASSAGIGLSGTTGVGLVQSAITAVSTFRARLGSYQSQLQYTLSGLQNYSENIQASESRIRNVDVAKETTSFSRYQIQVQAGTAMLAQANAMPQNVLSLLGG